MLLVSTLLHSLGADPADAPAAIAEYAADPHYVWTHLGQLAGFCGLGTGLVAFAATLEPGQAAAWGRIGTAGAVASVALALLGVTVACAANPNALWDIVHDECVPDMRGRGDPAPCATIALQDGVSYGYAALKDLRGVTQFLLIPTARVSGIEDAALLAPGVSPGDAGDAHVQSQAAGDLRKGGKAKSCNRVADHPITSYALSASVMV
jgi:CDP-diacylglycerol pyrophosphatase